MLKHNSGQKINSMPRFYIKVKPKASFNKVMKIDDNHFEIYTTAAAEKGKANEAIIKLLAEFLNISPSQLEIVSGFKSRQKIVESN